MKYMSTFDGLRALAILLVIGFHAGTPFLQGGFIGVDIFFVLSGFLISSILMLEYDKHGSINLKHFYLRRFLRLIPALWFMIFCLLAVGLVLLREDLKQILLGESLVSFFYVSNWAYSFEWVQTYLLKHTWSLSTEEQFYIVWPFIFLTVLKLRQSKKQLIGLSAFLIILSTLWRVYLLQTTGNITRVYYAFDTRADSILAGCILGILIQMPVYESLKTRMNAYGWNFTSMLLFLLSILGLFAVILTIETPIVYYLGQSVIWLLTVLMTLLMLQDKSPIIKEIFEWQPLVYIGKISYGLYLWHIPVFILLKSRFALDWPLLLILGFSLSLLICSLQYYFIEAPILRLKNRFR